MEPWIGKRSHCINDLSDFQPGICEYLAAIVQIQVLIICLNIISIAHNYAAFDKD